MKATSERIVAAYNQGMDEEYVELMEQCDTCFVNLKKNQDLGNSHSQNWRRMRMNFKN
jgi:hypothetical protein